MNALKTPTNELKELIANLGKEGIEVSIGNAKKGINENLSCNSSGASGQGGGGGCGGGSGGGCQSPSFGYKFKDGGNDVVKLAA